MPQFITNTMRLCTKDAANSSYDATVPARPRYGTNASAPSATTPVYDAEELCSSSPYEVPWTLDDPARADNPAAMFSVGSVPMWDGSPIPSNAKYPSDVYDTQLFNTNPGSSSFQTWGEGCMDGDLLSCARDSDCVSLDPSRVRLQCVRGVCVVDMKQSPSCYSHRDCAATDQMCSGDGQCVDPVLQVENHLNESIEFELYTQNCSTTSRQRYPVHAYDTYGASAWENIPDILNMYGMCSYHDWFEYLEFIDPTDDLRKNQGACGSRFAELGCDPASFNAFTSTWWDTQRPSAETDMPSLYDTRKFQVRRTPCILSPAHSLSPLLERVHDYVFQNNVFGR
jgi:hypothetical protein